MALMTARQHSEIVRKPPEAIPEVKEIGAVRPAVEDGTMVRMHHPDDPMKRMRVEFDLDGCVVKVERGVATVPGRVAAELERRGWLRGSEVKDD